MKFAVADNAGHNPAAARRSRLKWDSAVEEEVRWPSPNRSGQTRRSGARLFSPAGPRDLAETKVQLRIAFLGLACSPSWGLQTIAYSPLTAPPGSPQAPREPWPVRPPVGESCCRQRRRAPARVRFRQFAPPCAPAAQHCCLWDASYRRSPPGPGKILHESEFREYVSLLRLQDLPRSAPGPRCLT